MFEGKKYVTSGVSTRIPLYLQNLLWYMIETMDVSEKDRLQLFELEKVNENGKDKQKIIHKQEQPPYMTEQIITVKDAVEGKVFVIDDGPHSTMLLAEEY